jgi:hypothetical protein
VREEEVGKGEGRSRDIWNVGEPNGRLGSSGGAAQKRGWLGRAVGCAAPPPPAIYRCEMTRLPRPRHTDLAL